MKSFAIIRLLLILISLSITTNLLAASSQLAKNFYLGLSYADEGRYRQAIEKLEQAASGGYLPAQISLASWYHFGYEDIDIDIDEAIFWYEKAAQLGNQSAQLAVAGLYLSKQDDTKAFKWYQILAKNNNTNAQYYLAYMHANGKGTAKDLKRAFNWVEKSARQDNGQAQYMLSIFYKNGIGSSANNTAWLSWLKKSANNNFAKAQYDLATYYFFSKSGSNKSKSIAWLKKAYQQDFPEAIVVWEALKL